MRFIIPESKKSRIRVALITRGINFWLNQGREKNHPLALHYSVSRFNASSEYFDNPVGLSAISSEIDLAAVELLEFWAGGIWELNTGTLWFTLKNLTPSEQEQVMRDASFYFLDDVLFNKFKKHNFLNHINEVKMKPSDRIPSDVYDRLQMSLASLEQSLVNKDPLMPNHLRASHQLLIQYPETVHLLEDEEIARLIDAAELHTKTEIVKATVSKSTGAGSKKKVTIGDL